MKTPHRAASAAPTLDECKIQAAILLKDLRSDDRPRIERAAERLRALPHFHAHEPEAIVAQRDVIRRKHALTVIAAELGYTTWAECKRRLEPPTATRLDTETFFPARSASFLNRWFARYDEARASLEAEGGYLFPYRRQFFICVPGFLEARGIDPDDPDWERIGRDWLQPRDPGSLSRLEAKLVALGYGGQASG